jgi:signal transduction histidine kinase
LLQAQIKERSLKFEIPSSLPEVIGDKRRINQIVLNPLQNAINFTPEGGSVILRAKEEGSFLTVEIEDNGPEIPQEEVGRLFDPYFRGATHEGIPGVGLGFSLVKGMVELHQGKVDVKSELGKGSVFPFSLPMKKE